MINEKPIYMSYNFLSLYSNPFDKGPVERIDPARAYDGDRWCFVVFSDAVLIETELFTLHYYADILPVYDWRGYKLNPLIDGPDELLIDPLFKIMIGMGGARNRKRQDVEPAVANLTAAVKILLKFNFLASTRDRYNVSSALKDTLNQLTVRSILDQMKEHKLPDDSDPTELIHFNSAFFKIFHPYDPLAPVVAHWHESTPLTNNNLIKYSSIWHNYNSMLQGWTSLGPFSDGIKRIQHRYPSIFPAQSGGSVSYGDLYDLNKKKYTYIMRF